MGRILAIDYGQKRIGLAISDEKNKIALPLKALSDESVDKSIFKINEYAREYEIDKIIIGIPLGLKNVITSQTQETLDFMEELKKSTAISVERIDERFTSKIAKKFIINKKNKSKGDIDIKSAQVMLQDYLDKINN